MDKLLKMIIADDEAIVRNGLKRMVQWDTLGIEVIAEAADGLETLELCQQLNPDILFTDIRMPMMDGLEVAMKLEEMGSTIRVVFISGAQDFNFAKTALDINAEGYVLKPVNINELCEVMRKVTGRIKLERKQKTEMFHLKQQMHEHLPVIRENFLRNLLTGAYKNDPQLLEKIRYFQIPVQIEETSLVSVLQVDDFNSLDLYKTEEDKQLLAFSIHNVVNEIMNNHSAGATCSMKDHEIALIFNQKALNTGLYMEICEEMVYCLNQFLKISVSIGIGSRVSYLSAASVFNSYKDACSALQYKFYTGKSSILDVNDINRVNDMQMEHISITGLYESEDRLMNSVKLGDVASVSGIMDEIFDLLLEGNTSADYIQSACVEMICIALRTVQDLGESPETIIGQRSAIFEILYHKENVIELKNYLVEIFKKAAEHFSVRYNQKNNRVVSKIKEIIEARFSEDISVTKISDEVYLTPNYISLVFKQETGITLTEYITKIRMEKAKELLKTTDLRIMEISEKVGYQDPHYFSKAFKKYTGTFPKMFRT